jgi:NADPH2:quinone reductase
MRAWSPASIPATSRAASWPAGVSVSYAFAGRPGRMVADTVRGAVRVKLMNLRPGRRAALSMVGHEDQRYSRWR